MRPTHHYCKESEMTKTKKTLVAIAIGAVLTFVGSLIFRAAAES